MKGVTFLFILIIQCFTKICSKNQEIASNDLGITAAECAAQHCEEKDSLALWLQFQLSKDHNDLDLTKRLLAQKNRSLQGLNAENVSMSLTGISCALASLAGIVVGYSVGHACWTKTDQFTYSSIPSLQEEDDNTDYFVTGARKSLQTIRHIRTIANGDNRADFTLGHQTKVSVGSEISRDAHVINFEEL